MYTLIIEDRSGRSAAEISFDQGTYTIGRVDGNDVVLPSNSVSRTHARIFVDNNKCYIDDLASANGVFVDGIKCSERTEIKNGSKIRIGEYTLYLEYKDQNALNNGQEILKTQIVSGEQSGYKIVRVGDNFAGEEFMLSEESNTIGRTEDNYILLSDSSISRNHAKIVNSNMAFKVVDLNSSNGTFVNHKKVQREQILQSGDLVRFGNISFVFVPTAQIVDVRQYARQSQSNKLPFIMAAIFVLLLICIIFALLFTNLTKSEEIDEQQVAQENLVNEAEILKAKIEHAQKLYNEKRFQHAHEAIEPLIAKHPDNSDLNELNSKINDEIENENLFKAAESAIEKRDFDTAINNFKQIKETSLLYEQAQTKIAEATHRKLIIAYNDARSKCDEKSNEACISNLCNVVKTLSPKDDKAKIEDTMTYLEGLYKSKDKKLVKKAKECYKELSSFIK